MVTEKKMEWFRKWISGEAPEYWYKIRLGKWRTPGWACVTIEQRKANNFTGRFGGGWQWKLGIQASGSTVIISLFVMEISITWYGLTKSGKEWLAKEAEKHEAINCESS